MPPCLTLSIIRYGSRVKWNNPGKGVVPFPYSLVKREPLYLTSTMVANFTLKCKRSYPRFELGPLFSFYTKITVTLYYNIMVIIIRNGISSPSSNPVFISLCTNALKKSMSPSLLLPAMEKIVDQTGFFRLD